MLYHFTKISNFVSMKDATNIPQSILNAANELIDIYGVHFSHLGQYEDQDVYVYKFPEEIETGFPFVYLLSDDKVQEISGYLALDIISQFIENDCD